MSYPCLKGIELDVDSMNLNESLGRFLLECRHPETYLSGPRVVCKTCAIRWATSRVDDEVESLFGVITKETGHLTLASMINEFKSLRADAG